MGFREYQKSNNLNTNCSWGLMVRSKYNPTINEVWVHNISMDYLE